MSRTIRRLPITGGGIKTYATVPSLTRRRTGRAMDVYRPGVLYHWGRQPEMEQALQRIRDRLQSVPEVVPDAVSGFRVLRTFLVPETEEDVAEHNAATVLEWCHKNGTCKRQRLRAVRLWKRLVSRMDRAVGKAETRLLVYEALDDIQELPSRD